MKCFRLLRIVIETIETAENTERIVSEPGLGYLFVGPTDLINTLGVPTGTGRLPVHGGE